MLSHLLDVSIRSLILALAAFAFLSIAGRRRTAALQHAVFAIVVCGILALFAFGALLPRLPLRTLNPPAVAQTSPQSTNAAIPANEIDLPSIPTTPVAPHARTLHWEDFALIAYFAVALAFLIRFAAGFVLARRLFSTAQLTTAGTGNVYESPAVAVPVALGSKILLPPGWRDWTTFKLDAVLAHESAHVRRHDSLVAALAGLNRCLFWFHPLAWFLERRLTLLADRACDDSCIAELGDPEAYSHLLIEMASAVGAHGRLRSHLLTMAAPSHIRRRIDALLADRRTFSRGLSRTAFASLLLFAIPLVLFAGIAKLDRRPPTLSIDLPQPTAPAPPLLDPPRAPIQIAQAQTPASPLPATTPKYDDVSVTPCASGDAAGRGGRGGEGGRGIPPSPPGELFIHCLSIPEIIGFIVDSGELKLLNDPGGLNDSQRVRGGPAWISTDLWTIDAKTTDPVASHWKLAGRSPEAIAFNGSMVMAMLAARFGLQTHRTVEDVPMYSLTLAPGRPRLQLTGEDGCIKINLDGPHLVTDFAPVNGKPVCVQHFGTDGANWTIEAAGRTMSNLAAMLGGMVEDRPVLDKTGLTDRYTYRLKFAHDQFAPGRLPFDLFTPPTADDPLAPSLNTVLEQQLGLTLVPDKGPREFIVIDSAQRP